ncbi:MAG: hypothetical protein O7C98_06270 [Planctomycetota bacterium]|nr:hypothetical protein [Planctomycetota bacterium]
MSFLRPEALWVALVAVGVLAAHLIRRRARRMEVPFLPLWTAASETPRGFGASVLRALDLLLVLVSVAAVSLAAAAPYLPGRPGTVRDLVLVLDGGVELRAARRHEELLRAAGGEMARRAPGTRFVIIGVQDEIDTLVSTDRPSVALGAVMRHPAGWTRRPPDEGLALARTAAQDLNDPDLVFVTARRPAAPGFRVHSVGVAVDNRGFTALDVIDDPEGSGRLARVGLAGSGVLEIERIDTGEVWPVAGDGARSVDLPLPERGRVVFKLRGRDGFAYDDAVFLGLMEQPPPRVLVVAEAEPSPFLIAAMEALHKTGHVQGPLQRVTPGHAAEAANRYDVLVFDRCAAPVVVRRPALYIAPPATSSLPFRVGTERPAPTLFQVRDTHPLLAGLDLERIPPRRGRPVLGGESLARGAPGPLVAAAPGWIALGFDPDACVLASSPAYPLLLRNAIAVLGKRKLSAQPEFFEVGETVRVGGDDAPAQDLRLLGAPGFWDLKGRTLPVNLLLPGLDLTPPDALDGDKPDVGDPGIPDQPLTLPFAGAALFLLGLAWWIFWRSVR